MRKIFEGEPTQKPCIEEKKASKKATEDYVVFLATFLKLKNDNKEKIETLKRTEELLIEHKQGLINSIHAQAKYITEYNKRNYFSGKIPETLEDKQTRIELLAIDYKINIMATSENISRFSIDQFTKEIPKLKTVIAENKKEIDKQSKQDDILSEKVTSTNEALFDCLNYTLYLNLNLKTPCKEIKQKIKTVNQKSISLDNKLINLKYGVNNLKILNVNKTSFDKIIKIIKEFIIMLDKLNPNDYDSFDAIYKKTQNDLSSYQKERKVFISKIKTLEEKTKNIPEKKKMLKAKISNLFKEFKICLKN